MVTKVWILTPGSGHQAVSRWPGFVAPSLAPGSRVSFRPSQACADCVNLSARQETLTALARDTRIRVPDDPGLDPREDRGPRGTKPCLEESGAPQLFRVGLI